jgi:peptidoglycan/LPS O-acetylase OafA/YrhL
MFAAGVTLYLLADRAPIRWRLAGASAAIIVVVLAVLDHPFAFVALPLAYLVLWLGCRLPLQGLFRRNDISYGVYIYAFPVQQLTATTVLARHGIILDLAAVSVFTAVPASLSWFVVEKNALALKNASLRGRDVGVVVEAG